MSSIAIEGLYSLNEAWVYGFSYRKFLILKTFLPHTQLKRIKQARQIPADATLIVWGMCSLPAELQHVQQLIRVEDGFIRSVGLGAAFNSPISWVFDDLGMYFNTQIESRLEQLLNQHEFTQDECTQARILQRQLVSQKLSKYNLQNIQVTALPNIQSRQKVLVIGQVEGDASLQFGSPYIKRNLDFLAQVRQLCPDAYLVYRPHPDVSAGWRKDSLELSQAQQYADEIKIEGDITDWLDWANEVHVMTSSTGFEALMRAKHVVCHGLPFYSGWGLTHDLYALDRIKRSINLEQLIAGALILYPQYRSLLNKSHCAIDAKQAMDELVILKAKKKINWLKWLQPLMKY